MTERAELLGQLLVLVVGLAAALVALTWIAFDDAERGACLDHGGEVVELHSWRDPGAWVCTGGEP